MTNPANAAMRYCLAFFGLDFFVMSHKRSPIKGIQKLATMLTTCNSIEVILFKFIFILYS